MRLQVEAGATRLLRSTIRSAVAQVGTTREEHSRPQVSAGITTMTRMKEGILQLCRIAPKMTEEEVEAGAEEEAAEAVVQVLASGAIKKGTWLRTALMLIKVAEAEDEAEVEEEARPVSDAGKKAISPESVLILLKTEEAGAADEEEAALPEVGAASSATRKATGPETAPTKDLTEATDPTRDRGEKMVAQSEETMTTMTGTTAPTKEEMMETTTISGAKCSNSRNLIGVPQPQTTIRTTTTVVDGDFRGAPSEQLELNKFIDFITQD
jgi:hypothetical protein